MEETNLTINEEFRLLKALEVMFNDNHNTLIPKDNRYAVIDRCNVCFVEGKSELSKTWLLRFLNIDNGENKCKQIDLDFKPVEIKEQTDKLSLEYLKNIIKILELSGEDSVNLTIKSDYPAVLENKHLRFILAPRVEN